MEEKWKFLRDSKNPYSYYDVFGEPNEFQQPAAVEIVSPILPEPQAGKLSKEAFQNGSRRILLQYVPPAEGSVLRPHYRDFITRNELRSPEQRFRLLQELSKYDISASRNFKSHFNREPELFTAGKLKQIERAALSVSVSK